jgi:hypothetical protein
MEPKIHTYLTSAFRDLDTFSVSDLGTFRKEYREAFWDEMNSQFLPPRLEVVFEQNVYEGMDLGIYLHSYLQLPQLDSQKLVLDIRNTIFSQIEKLGYFEIPEVGTLEKTAGNNLEFFMLSATDNALDDDFFGLEPVRFSKKTEIMLQQSDNPTFMNNQNNPERSVNLSSVGWKTFLLIALIFTLGFFVVDQGPFVIHRSSLNEDMLQVRNIIPPRHNDLLAMNERDETKDGGNTNQIGSEESEPIEEEIEIPEEEAINPENTPIPDTVDDPRDQVRNAETPIQEQPVNSEIARLPKPVEKPINLSILDTANKKQMATRGGEELMPEAPTNYHLIAASFKTIGSAQEYLEEMNENNLDAIILMPPQGSSQTYRISIYRNRDRLKVQNFKDKLEKLGRKSGWIYKELGVK